MKIHQMEQGSEAWFEIRKGKLTGSHAQAIAASGKGLETLCYEILAQQYSSGEREYYTNKDLERGHELEDLAINAYEMETGKKVEKVGFIELDEDAGVSPDGLVDEDGLVEVKSPNDVNYFRVFIEKKIDTKYEWQCQMQLFVSGRKYCDIIFYNPNFKRSLFIHRFTPDPEKFAKIKAGIEAGKQQIAALKKLV